MTLLSEKAPRIAIIGTGMIANAAHIPAINNLRRQGLVELVACADIRPEAAQETAARYDIPSWYADPQKMLDEIHPAQRSPVLSMERQRHLVEMMCAIPRCIETGETVHLTTTFEEA